MANDYNNVLKNIMNSKTIHLNEKKEIKWKKKIKQNRLEEKCLQKRKKKLNDSCNSYIKCAKV